jgi:hypothetical protein
MINNSHPFVQTEISLSRLQEPARPEPFDSSQHLHLLFHKTYSLVILPLTRSSSKTSLPSGFSDLNFFMYAISHYSHALSVPLIPPSSSWSQMGLIFNEGVQIIKFLFMRFHSYFLNETNWKTFAE